MRPSRGSVYLHRVAELTVYEKPTCTTCRKLAALLTERGIDFERVDYHVEPLPEDKLRELVAKGGVPARDWVRRKELPALGLEPLDEAPDDRVIALMAEYPQLLERPVVERGGRAVLARPVERVHELLD
jgi:arsenate reductase